MYEQQPLRLGVPMADIIQEPNSVNTWKNAQLTSDLISDRQSTTLFWCSSACNICSVNLFQLLWIERNSVRADYMAAQISWLPLWYNLQ
ncbi:YdcF family protein [Vibrio lentus]|nr:YdcF family protein [Vibrio lentus]